MLFNSTHFLFIFLPIAMLGFHLLGQFGRRPVITWLALVSVVFYAVWNPPYVLFLLGSVAVNYLCATLIARAPATSALRRRLLFAGVSLNLLALFYFKYLFKLMLLLDSVHLAELHPHPILLPLGISFFTFTQIAYLVDLSQEQAELQDFLSYLLFVTFFPHLIAGPMLHHREMMPQFNKTSGFALNSSDVSLGLTWFVLGLAKKVLIADNLMGTAEQAFAHVGSLSSASAVTGVAAYTMQLYFDFSGYSDMAIGLARIFSIRFPLNFDSPYKATSVTEYWQRWHITLTRYITLYLYNPLLMSVQRRRVAAGCNVTRKALATPGGFMMMVAYPTMATMVLTGLWHGAGVQYLIFGLIHGVYLTANQAWRHFRQPTVKPATGVTRFGLMVVVYVQVAFALIFFRSSSMHTAVELLHDIAGAHGLGSLASLQGGWLAVALFPVVWFLPNTQQILGQETATAVPIPGPGAPTTLAHEQAPSVLARVRWSPTIGWGLTMAALFFAVLVSLDRPATFLYFQF